jgi:GMP synthase (glutamine-hydrolysing)
MRVGAMLDGYEISYHLIRAGRDQLPDPTTYQALIVLGCSRHMYDKHRYPYTVHEEATLHQAIKQGISYLGMCLGAQLLVHAFGAPVKKLPKVHIGFLQIDFPEAGKKESSLQELARPPARVSLARGLLLVAEGRRLTGSPHG